MHEVCSQIQSILQNELKSQWHELFTWEFAELISGSKLQSAQFHDQQEAWWQRIGPHAETWSGRQAGSICRRVNRRLAAGQNLSIKQVPESEIHLASRRLYHAVRQLILVRTLIDGGLATKQERQIRQELWLELAPQVERAAQCYQKSAAKRGFEVDDLIQDASAHFQRVITRFDPDDSRRAMLGTWFDDVVDNLFAAAVRPRKSDPFKRGLGEPTDDDDSEDLPASPKPSLRTVRDFQQQQHVSEALSEIDEICGQLIETGICSFERVLAFKLYVCEGLTYQETADALKSQGYHYGTTQTFNFVKEVKAHVLGRFESD